MGGACSTYGGDYKCVQHSTKKKLQGGDYLGVIGTDARIILKR
jgi:hypothetical protein